MIDDGAAGCWAACNDREMACDVTHRVGQLCGRGRATCQSRPHGNLGVRVTGRECMNHVAGALPPAEPIFCENLCWHRPAGSADRCQNHGPQAAGPADEVDCVFVLDVLEDDPLHAIRGDRI